TLPLLDLQDAERPVFFAQTWLILHKFLGIMSQIQALFLRHQSNPPLLHSKGAKKNVDGFAIFVAADFSEDIAVRGDIVPLDSPDQKSSFGSLSHSSTQGSFEGLR